MWIGGVIREDLEQPPADDAVGALPLRQRGSKVAVVYGDDREVGCVGRENEKGSGRCVKECAVLQTRRRFRFVIALAQAAAGGEPRPVGGSFTSSQYMQILSIAMVNDSKLTGFRM